MVLKSKRICDSFSDCIKESFLEREVVHPFLTYWLDPWLSSIPISSTAILSITQTISHSIQTDRLFYSLAESDFSILLASDILYLTFIFTTDMFMATFS